MGVQEKRGIVYNRIIKEKMKDKIEFIRKKCIEANPEINKLDMGCAYKRKAIKGAWHKHTLVRPVSYENLCGCKQGMLSTQAFRSFKCGLCKKEKSWPNGGVPKWCLDCASERKVCPHCKTGLEILGREIRLADMLITLEGKVRNESALVLIAMWNLLKDSLQDQSEETIDFIYDLLK